MNSWRSTRAGVKSRRRSPQTKLLRWNEIEKAPPDVDYAMRVSFGAPVPFEITSGGQLYLLGPNGDFYTWDDYQIGGHPGAARLLASNIDLGIKNPDDDTWWFLQRVMETTGIIRVGERPYEVYAQLRAAPTPRQLAALLKALREAEKAGLPYYVEINNEFDHWVVGTPETWRDVRDRIKKMYPQDK